MYRPEHVAGWRRIVDFVHRTRTAKIGMQLAHAGRKGATTLPWQGGGPLPPGRGVADRRPVGDRRSAPATRCRAR